jgi:hypothetical protein
MCGCGRTTGRAADRAAADMILRENMATVAKMLELYRRLIEQQMVGRAVDAQER